jgi:hypothetical protein
MSPRKRSPGNQQKYNLFCQLPLQSRHADRPLTTKHTTHTILGKCSWGNFLSNKPAAGGSFQQPDKVTTRYTEGKKSNPVQMVSQMVVVVDQHGAKTILHEAENQNEMFFLS